MGVVFGLSSCGRSAEKNRKKVLKKYFFGTFCSQTLKPFFSRTVLGTIMIHTSIDRANHRYHSTVLSKNSITWFRAYAKSSFFSFLAITSDSQQIGRCLTPLQKADTQIYSFMMSKHQYNKRRLRKSQFFLKICIYLYNKVILMPKMATYAPRLNLSTKTDILVTPTQF